MAGKPIDKTQQEPCVSRRSLLASTSAGALVVVAGCLGDDDGDDGADGDGGGNGENGDPDIDMAEVCDEADVDDPIGKLPRGTEEWEEGGGGGQSTGSHRVATSGVYEHEDYGEVIGYLVQIHEHDQWDREEILETTERFDEHEPALTIIEVGDWAYIAMGQTHEGNRAMLQLFEWVSAECAEAAREIDPEEDQGEP